MRKLFLQIIVCFYFIGVFIIPNIYAIPTIKQYTFKKIESNSFYDRISIWTNVRNIALNKSENIKGSTRRIFFGFGLGSSKAEVFSKQRCAWEMPLSSLLSDSSSLGENNFLHKLKKYLGFLRRVNKNAQSENAQSENAQSENARKNFSALKFGHCNNSGIKSPIYKYPLAITEGLPLHPHNNVLQITLELGFVGIFLFFLMIQLCIQGIWKLNSNPCYLCMLSGTLLSFLIISSISYGIWQSWWVCTLWLVLSVSQRIRSDENLE